MINVIQSTFSLAAKANFPTSKNSYCVNFPISEHILFFQILCYFPNSLKNRYLRATPTAAGPRRKQICRPAGHINDDDNVTVNGRLNGSGNVNVNQNSNAHNHVNDDGYDNDDDDVNDSGNVNYIGKDMLNDNDDGDDNGNNRDNDNVTVNLNASFLYCSC